MADRLPGDWRIPGVGTEKRRRYDIGDRLDYLNSSILLPLDREDLGPELASGIKEMAPSLPE